jgi:hypothetical protein
VAKPSAGDHWDLAAAAVNETADTDLFIKISCASPPLLSSAISLVFFFFFLFIKKP